MLAAEAMNKPPTEATIRCFKSFARILFFPFSFFVFPYLILENPLRVLLCPRHSLRRGGPANRVVEQRAERRVLPRLAIVAELDVDDGAALSGFDPRREIAELRAWVQIGVHVLGREVGAQKRVDGLFEDRTVVGLVDNLKAVAESLCNRVRLVYHSDRLARALEISRLRMVDAAHAKRLAPIARDAHHFGELGPAVRPRCRCVMPEDHRLAQPPQPL